MTFIFGRRASEGRRAINPGEERSLMVTRGHTESQAGRTTERIAQIPNLIVRVRFPSPAPRAKTQVTAGMGRPPADLREPLLVFRAISSPLTKIAS
jgi:hypothetical protein